jgi:hypothetical protein
MCLAIGLREDLPIEMAKRIARHVLAVLRELDAEAVVSGLRWEAREESLDDEPRREIEACELRDEVGIEEARTVFAHAGLALRVLAVDARESPREAR